MLVFFYNETAFQNLDVVTPMGGLKCSCGIEVVRIAKLQC